MRLTDLLANVTPGQAGDQSRGRRAAASGAAFRRAGACNDTSRSSAAILRTRARSASAARSRMAVAALRAAARARSRTRNPGAERHARGPVPRRHRRAPHCRAAAKANLRSSFPIRFTRPMPPAPTRPTCEPVYLPATARKRFPSRSRRARPTICSRARSRSISPRPSNPQGAVADSAYLARLVALRAAFRFSHLRRRMLFGNLFRRKSRPARSNMPAPIMPMSWSFNSLSKRSSLPGLRVGFAAGDRNFLTRFVELRNVAAPQVPVPLQEVAVAAYADETHVEENRRLYAAEIRSRRPDPRRALRLQAPRRRLLPLARCLRLRRQRRGRPESSGARPACAYCPAAMPRAPLPTDRIRARNISASPWCRTMRPRRRRCIALSPCSD